MDSGNDTWDMRCALERFAPLVDVSRMAIVD
jgi:hypothetical protein